VALTSVLDPDPKLSAGSGSRKIIPDPGAPDPEMILKRNYSEKLIKFEQFLNKMLY
jgi:hypothetical protein